jgi:hypothetical protein
VNVGDRLTVEVEINNIERIHLADVGPYLFVTAHPVGDWDVDENSRTLSRHIPVEPTP